MEGRSTPPLRSSMPHGRPLRRTSMPSSRRRAVRMPTPTPERVLPEQGRAPVRVPPPATLRSPKTSSSRRSSNRPPTESRRVRTGVRTLRFLCPLRTGLFACGGLPRRLFLDSAVKVSFRRPDAISFAFVAAQRVRAGGEWKPAAFCAVRAASSAGRGLPNDDTAKSFRQAAADSRVGCLSGFLLGMAMP